MKEIKQIFFKCIEINIQYGNELITIKSEPFKTLENIINKAVKKMANIPPNNIHYFYLGVDITRDKRKTIGDLFYQFKKVNIKLKSIEMNNSLKNNLYIKSDKNKSYSLDKSLLTTNYQNNNIGNKRVNTFKSLILKDSKFPSVFSNYAKNAKLMLKPKYKKELNSLNNIESHRLPFINRSFFEYSKDEDMKYLCNCKKLKISNYCRNCKSFICNNCKNTDSHKNHLMIYINTDNFIESIINYGNNIQNEIINNINVHKTLFENSQILTYNTLSKEKENIIEKYQKMIDNYYIISNKIESYLKKENKEILKLKIESYNELLNKLNEEINDLISRKHYNKININNLENIFNEINSKEDMISIFSKDILRYHLINEINIKIKSSIKIIEKIVEDLINKDNPFNLDNKYYHELINMKIIELPKKEEEDKEKKKTSIIIGGHEISQAILSKRRKNIFSLLLEREKEGYDDD